MADDVVTLGFRFLRLTTSCSTQPKLKTSEALVFTFPYLTT